MTVLLCAAISVETKASDASRITLDVRGADDEIEMVWLENFDGIRLGDTIEVRLRESADADPPRTRKSTKTLEMRREEAQHAETLRCSFCGLPQSEHRRLIAGPSVFVCKNCVEVCTDLLKEGR